MKQAEVQETDLFDNYETLPQEVKDILDSIEDGQDTYEHCEALIKKLNAVGYTCEYYLDAVPYGLKKL